MVMERDEAALEWIEKFKMANSKQIAQIAYGGDINITNKRMRRFVKDNLLYKKKDPYNLGYIYSAAQIRSVKQYRHNMLRNELYLKLSEICEIHHVEVQKQYGGLCPDMILTCTYKGKDYGFFFEVETSNNKIITEKYNNFFLTDCEYYFNKVLPVVYITTKPIKGALYDYKKIDLKLENLLDIFR